MVNKVEYTKLEYRPNCQQTAFAAKAKIKHEGLGTCHNALAADTQTVGLTRERQHFTMAEVAADWKKTKVKPLPSPFCWLLGIPVLQWAVSKSDQAEYSIHS